MPKRSLIVLSVVISAAALSPPASAQGYDWLVPFPYPASSQRYGYIPPSMVPATTYYQAPVMQPVTTMTYYQAPVATVTSRPRVYGYRAFPARTVRTVRAPVVVNNYYYQAPAAAWYQPTPWVFGATQTAGW